MHETICVESDARKDAGRALDMLHTQLLAVVIDPYSWKWALLVLHHAMQMVFATTLEDQDHPSEEARPADPLRVFRSLRPNADPSGDLSLPRLFARLRATTELQVTDEVERDIERLDRFHRAFIGGFPTRWELGIHGLPRIAQNCLRIIDQLGWLSEQGSAGSRRLTEGARAKLVASVNVLEALERQYRT